MRILPELVFLGVLCAQPAVAAALPDEIFHDLFEAALSAVADTWTWVPFDNAYCGTTNATTLQ